MTSHNKPIKEVRVSSKTNPKQIATSILYSLNEGKLVRAVSIGESIKTLTKSIALLNTIKPKDIRIDFQPKFEYIETNEGIANAVVWFVEKINE